MSTLYVDNLQPNLGSRVMAAGHVVQVVEHILETVAVGTSSSTFASTGLTQSITPTATSSKILVSVNVNGLYKSNVNSAVVLRITDGTTSYEYESLATYDNVTGSNSTGSASFQRLYSPNSTSAQTYTVEFMNPLNSGTVYINSRWGSGRSSMSSIHLMEIAQ